MKGDSGAMGSRRLLSLHTDRPRSQPPAPAPFHHRKGRESVAIIGAGVSGLGAAWTLRHRHDVRVFERATYVGGHTHTVTVPRDGGSVRVDTGFIVYNETTYPLLTALFDELGVETRPTNMSFSVECRRCGWLYSGLGPTGVFVRPSSAARPRFLRFLLDIHRFNRTHRDAPGGGSPSGREDAGDGTLASFLARAEARGEYGSDFGRHYLLPLASALWSTGIPEVGAFPIDTLLAFFRGHRLLQIRDRLPWRTVSGGSRRYVDAMLEVLGDRVHRAAGVRALRREADGVRLVFDDGGSQSFDRVVVACHADQALALLEDPTDDERDLLSTWSYNDSETVLHSDDSVLAPRAAARASWNYHLDDCADPGPGPTMTYNLGRLQNLGERPGMYVTLNPRRTLDPVHLTRRYRHPVFTPDTVASQAPISALGDDTRTHFAGAYLGYGFHEDGLRAGVTAGRRVLAG